MTANEIHQWRAPAQAPAWLTEALLARLTPWSGAYSVVYPTGDHQVVKLVSEEGALHYLRMCQNSRDYFCLPRVLEVVDFQVQDDTTGLRYWPVRMERLLDGGAQVERFSKAYVRLVRALESQTDCNVALSVLAAQALARELLPSEPDLSTSLHMLANEAQAQGWVLDLGASDNWMLRTDGTVVLSDPVHLVQNFADDLV